MSYVAGACKGATLLKPADGGHCKVYRTAGYYVVIIRLQRFHARMRMQYGIVYISYNLYIDISRLVFIYDSIYVAGTADGVDMHACMRDSVPTYMCAAILPRDHGDGIHTVSQTAKNILCSIVDGN